ncbi:MAG TPA: 5'-nucleotidase, lipoprotein e(P4) family [Pyrinomonadaceae bacterium]|nr:5'-nucleotidase, lipoprotein e(P4) family [Pyrinomonadaceae bacterium]
MITYAKFVRVTVLTSLLFLPAHLLAQTATSPQTSTVNEYQTYAVLWTQSSAEYRALALQAFTLARLRVDQDLAQHRSRRRMKPPAIIVDADETVLDNSRFQAELILRGVEYTSQAWHDWVNRAEGGAVPGALEFLNYAFRRGVRVFYITNRRQTEKAGTVANLKKLGFPDVSEETVMIREQGTTSSKETRRQSVRSRYRVVLLVGDNLNDFNDDFAGKSIADRKAQVDREQAEFGTQFIVVPNPMYGDWESAVYGNASSETERRERRRAALRGITVQPGP